MTNYTKKALWNSAYMIIFGMLASFCAYLLRILLASSLQSYEYGLVYAIFAFVGLFSLFQHFGLGQALIKYISTFLVKKEYSKIKEVILLVVIYQLIFSILLGLVFLVLSSFLGKYYFGYPEISTFLFRVYLISIVLSPFDIVIASIFQGYQRIDLFSYANLIKFAFILFSTWVMLRLGFGVIAVVYAYALYPLLMLIAFLPAFFHLFPYFLKEKYTLTVATSKMLFGFGIPVLLATAAGIVMSYTDTFVLTIFRSLEEVGMYNAALPTVQILWFLPALITTIFFPLSSELHERKESKLLAKGITVLYKYAVAIILPAAIIMVAFPSIILNLLFGEQYISGATSLQILAVASIFYTIVSINASVFAGMGKPEVNTKITIIASILNLVGNFLLIPKFGMFGAAVSTAVAFFVMMILSLQILRKSVNVAIPLILWSKLFIAAMFSLGAIALIKLILITNPWIELLLSAAAAGIVYLSILYAMKIFTYNELAEYIGRLRK